MEQTPAHNLPNLDLLAVMPLATRVVEAGCSTGALAKAYKLKYPNSHYVGIEISPAYAAQAEAHCDDVKIGNIEQLLADTQLNALNPSDCWVFGDTLEHLNDPWQVLRTIHPMLSQGGCICACIPNMQHWSIQLRLNLGKLDYADSGLLDRTHLRWFTRTTMIDLFNSCGYQIEQILPRIFPHPEADKASQIVGLVASQIGHDPNRAIADALPLQYVIKANKI